MITLKKIENLLFFMGLVLLPFSLGEYGLFFLSLLTLIFGSCFFLDLKFKKEYSAILLLGSLLFFSQLLSTMYSPAAHAAWLRLGANFIGFIIFLYLLSPLATQYKEFIPKVRLDSAIITLIFSATIMSIYYLFNFTLQSLHSGFDRVVIERYLGGVSSLPWGASNLIASLLIFPFFLSLYVTAKNCRISRLFYFVCTVLIFAAIIMTFSRGAILATLSGLLLFVLLDGYRTLVRFFVIVLVTISFSYLVDTTLLNGFIYNDVASVIIARFTDSDIQTGNNRFEIWSDYIRIIEHSPLWGAGYLGSNYLYGATAHNIILTTLADRGLIGFVLSSSILIAAVRVIFTRLSKRVLSEVQTVYRFIAAGSLASMIHLLVEDAHFTLHYIVYSWVFLGIIFKCKQHGVNY